MKGYEVVGQNPLNNKIDKDLIKDLENFYPESLSDYYTKISEKISSHSYDQETVKILSDILIQINEFKDNADFDIIRFHEAKVKGIKFHNMLYDMQYSERVTETDAIPTSYFQP